MFIKHIKCHFLFLLFIIFFGALSFWTVLYYPTVDYGGDESWFFNKAIHYIESSSPANTIFPEPLRYYYGNHPTVFDSYLFSFFQSLFVKGFGADIYSIRLFSVTCCLVLIIILYFTLYRVVNKAAALSGIIVFAVSTKVFYLSMIGRQEMMLSLCVFIYVISVFFIFFPRGKNITISSSDSDVIKKYARAIIAGFFCFINVIIHPIGTLLSLINVVFFIVILSFSIKNEGLYHIIKLGMAFIAGIALMMILWMILLLADPNISSGFSFSFPERNYNLPLLTVQWFQIIKLPLYYMRNIFWSWANYPFFTFFYDTVILVMFVISAIVLFRARKTFQTNYILMKHVFLYLFVYNLLSMFILPFKLSDYSIIQYPYIIIIISSGIYIIADYYKSLLARKILYSVICAVILFLTWINLNKISDSSRFDYKGVKSRFEGIVPEGATMLGHHFYYPSFMRSRFISFYVLESEVSFPDLIKKHQIDYIIYDDLFVQEMYRFKDSVYIAELLTQLESEFSIVREISINYPSSLIRRRLKTDLSARKIIFEGYDADYERSGQGLIQKGVIYKNLNASPVRQTEY